MTFAITGIFPDHSLLAKKLSLDVEPPSRQPRALGVRSYILTSMKAPRQTTTAPAAFYDGRKSGVALQPGFVRYEIGQGSDHDVIHLDQTAGLIRPLHVGHALVSTSYGGVTSRTCVVVVERQADLDRKHPDCSDLLGPGERLGGAK